MEQHRVSIIDEKAAPSLELMHFCGFFKAWRRCQSNEERSLFGRLLPEAQIQLCDKVLPLGPGGGAALLVGLAVNEMSFELEVVVQAGVNRGELL